MLSARRLRDVMKDLAGIAHVKIIRIHTRVPVSDPKRIDADIVRALRVEGATTWLALHANHPKEFTASAREACARIVDAGIPMVSQSVLLRGVNDDAATIEALMRSFVENRIKPYYLHHGDLAPGTAHLRTTIDEGQRLMRALRGSVSGLCQPDYVLDIPGGAGKSPIGPSYAEEGDNEGEGKYRIRDYCGEVHTYPPVQER
jgi:lysine 2,3-aminomutase